MPETENLAEETEEKKIEEIYTRVAQKVREDSQNLAKLTSLSSLVPLVTDLVESDANKIDLAAMIEDEEYSDIKFVSTSPDVVYLYSEPYISREDAGILARKEEIQTGIAQKVREDSQNLAKLTSVEFFNTLVADLEPHEIEVNLAEMQQDERYNDIRSITIATGAVVLYSETYITSNYAKILVRAEVNDPLATIVETVREESRVYPRPTNIELFKEQVFNINPNELENHLKQVLEQQEFNDIKIFQASTGAQYLYSTRYINDDHARSLIEWEEVGQYENP